LAKCNRALSSAVFTLPPVLFIVLNFLLDWPVVRASAGLGDREFGDLFLVLESGECFRTIGFDVYSSELTAGLATCPTFVYGSISLLLAAISGVSVGYVLGVFQALLFAALVGLWCRRLFDSKWRGGLVSLAIVASPPVQLMIVSGNLDTWIGILLLLFLVREGVWSETRRLLPLAMATLVKFYTLPLLVVSSFRAGRSAGNGLSRLALFALLAVTTVTVLSDVTKLESLPAPTEASFGFLSFQMYLKYLSFNVPGFVPLLAPILCMLLPLAWRPWRNLLFRVDAADSGFLDISIVFLFVFFAAQNYDHRLFLLTFLVAMALKPSTMFPQTVAWIGYVSAWLSSSLGIQFARGVGSEFLWKIAGAGQLLGDFLLAIFVGAIFIRLIVKVTQWIRFQPHLGRAT